jgi:hypothetical protein
VEFIDNGDEEDEFFPKTPAIKKAKKPAPTPVPAPVEQAKARESALGRYFPKKSKLKKNAP